MRVIKQFIPLGFLILGAMVTVIAGVNNVPDGTTFFDAVDSMRVWGWIGIAMMIYGLYRGFKK